MLFFGFRKGLTEMSETPALANRHFILNLNDSGHKCVGKIHNPDANSGFLGFSDHIAGFVIDLLLPPVVICGYAKDSETVPLQIIWVTRKDILHGLDKRKEVSA